MLVVSLGYNIEKEYMLIKSGTEKTFTGDFKC